MQLSLTFTLTLSLFDRERGNLWSHRVRVTGQGSRTGTFDLSSPRSERGEDQGEGRFRLYSYGLVRPAGVCTRPPTMSRPPPVRVQIMARAPISASRQMQRLLIR